MASDDLIIVYHSSLVTFIMAVVLKNKHQIAQLREAGRLVAQTYEVLRPHIVPGVTTGELDRIASTLR